MLTYVNEHRTEYMMTYGSITPQSVAAILRALLPLLNQQYYARCMFATDDKHPLDLLQGGHIDYIIREAIAAAWTPSLP